MVEDEVAFEEEMQEPAWPFSPVSPWRRLFESVDEGATRKAMLTQRKPGDGQLVRPLEDGVMPSREGNARGHKSADDETEISKNDQKRCTVGHVSGDGGILREVGMAL